MLQMIPRKERFMFHERVTKKDEYVKYFGRKVKLKAKVVCESCNNGWMSQLESATKLAMKDLLFESTATVINSKDIVAISAFALKTLVLANHKDLTSTPFFTSAQRFRFKRELRIPDGVQIWMASRKILTGKYYGFWKSVHGKSEEKFTNSFAIYACTWNFQNVVLQILATKWQDKRRRETTPPIAFPQEDYWKEASVLIWPHDGTAIQWPPVFYLGNDTLEEFRDRWNTIKVTF
jgi:hypothetical protein